MREISNELSLINSYLYNVDPNNRLFAEIYSTEDLILLFNSNSSKTIDKKKLETCLEEEGFNWRRYENEEGWEVHTNNSLSHCSLDFEQ